MQAEGNYDSGRVQEPELERCPQSKRLRVVNPFCLHGDPGRNASPTGQTRPEYAVMHPCRHESGCYGLSRTVPNDGDPKIACLTRGRGFGSGRAQNGIGANLEQALQNIGLKRVRDDNMSHAKSKEITYQDPRAGEGRNARGRGANARPAPRFGYPTQASEVLTRRICPQFPACPARG
jgi:hypothetical protein